MQNLQYATSDPQETGSPPGAKCNKVGCVSSASSTGLHFLNVGHTYSLWLNHLLISFKRLNGVAEAGGRPPGWGLGWRTQLSVWAQGISLMLEHSLIADQNHSPSSHLWEKSSGKFLSRNGSWKKVVWWRKCLWDLWNRLLSFRLTNKRVRSRNLNVTTAADWLNKHLNFAVLLLHVQIPSHLV